MAMVQGKNKMVKEEEVKTKNITQSFFFPQYQISVEAENIDEAEKKLQEIINKK